MNFMHQMRCERESFLKIYTADKNFTRPPVAPVAPNINSVQEMVQVESEMPNSLTSQKNIWDFKSREAFKLDFLEKFVILS